MESNFKTILPKEICRICGDEATFSPRGTSDWFCTNECLEASFNENMTGRQELFNYLSKELGATALETDLLAIERIAQLGIKEENERLYQNIDSMKQTNLALANKAVEFQAKYEKCISIIKRFDAGMIAMYDL